ncbi:MAG: hypothetical protein ACOX4M_09355 [Acetivibrionales bacterium]
MIVVITVAAVYFLTSKNNTDLPASKREPKAHASWATHYTDVEDITDNSDLIVIGTVIDSIPEKRVNMIFTMQVIKIEKYIKGEKVPDDTVKVLQTGGELNGEKTYAFEDAPLFKINDKYLLFLEKTSEGHYLVAGGYQGSGKIVNGKVRFNVESDNIAKVFDKKRLEDVEALFNEDLGKDNDSEDTGQ